MRILPIRALYSFALSLSKGALSFVDPSKSDLSVRSEFFGTKKDGKYLPGDTRSWDLPEARKALRVADIDAHLTGIAYRPFDFRTYYNGLDLVDWPPRSVRRLYICNLQ
jgi:hypothetical protein